MSAFFITVLVIHILSAIVAFGPVFAFPVMAKEALRDAPSGRFIYAVMHVIETRIVVPVALSMAVTGVLLLLGAPGGTLDLQKNAWLGASIAIYAAAVAFALTVQVPAGAQLATKTAEPSPDTAAVDALLAKLKYGGMLLSLAVVVIVVLMVWRPGGTI